MGGHWFSLGEGTSSPQNTGESLMIYVLGCPLVSGGSEINTYLIVQQLAHIWEKRIVHAPSSSLNIFSILNFLLALKRRKAMLSFWTGMQKLSSFHHKEIPKVMKQYNCWKVFPKWIQAWITFRGRCNGKQSFLAPLLWGRAPVLWGNVFLVFMNLDIREKGEEWKVDISITLTECMFTEIHLDLNPLTTELN